MYRIYLYNYGVLEWYLKYRFWLRTKKHVIIEQNNICFNRNMLMLGWVTPPSWQRLSLSLWTNWARNAHRREFLTSNQVLGLCKLQFANSDHRLLLNITVHSACISKGAGLMYEQWLSPQPRCLPRHRWGSILLPQRAQDLGPHLALVHKHAQKVAGRLKRRYVCTCTHSLLLPRRHEDDKYCFPFWDGNQRGGSGCCL